MFFGETFRYPVDYFDPPCERELKGDAYPMENTVGEEIEKRVSIMNDKNKLLLDSSDCVLRLIANLDHLIRLEEKSKSKPNKSEEYFNALLNITQTDAKKIHASIKFLMSKMQI